MADETAVKPKKAEKEAVKEAASYKTVGGTYAPDRVGPNPAATNYNAGAGGGGGSYNPYPQYETGTSLQADITLAPTAVKTSAYTAAVRDLVICDATSAAFAVTLPTAPADRTRVGVLLVATASSHAVTATAGGSDKINVTGTTTKAYSVAGTGGVFQYKSSNSTWYVVGSMS